MRPKLNAFYPSRVGGQNLIRTLREAEPYVAVIVCEDAETLRNSRHKVHVILPSRLIGCAASEIGPVKIPAISHIFARHLVQLSKSVAVIAKNRNQVLIFSRLC